VARALESEGRDGAWFVSLASVAKAEHVASAIAHALGVTPLAGETPDVAVERFLARKEGLLVLDNFEHVLSAAPLVSDLLVASARLKVLATSREALRLKPEQRYALAPLDVPADGQREVVEHAAAGALFVERARTHDRSFELTDANASAIAEVCRRLDGLPLAIELAAARTAMLGAEELNARLVVALDALGSGPRDAPDRQRTLRATIDWSYRLLSEAEAHAFAHIAVFAGGATTEAALEVTGAHPSTLEGLLDKQLLLRRARPGADSRLLMLETVREFALERLEADGAAAEIHERHSRYFLALAERAEPELDTRGDEQWLPRLDAEIDNFRAALGWSLRHGDPTIGLHLTVLLGRYFEIRSREAEGREGIEAALHSAGDAAPLRERARAQRALVRLDLSEGVAYDPRDSMERARARAGEALALSRRAGGPADVAEALLGLAGFERAESHPQRRRTALAEEH
jgi:predicted ATPase